MPPKRKAPPSSCTRVAASGVFRAELAAPDAVNAIKRIRHAYTRQSIHLPGLTDPERGYIACTFLPLSPPASEQLVGVTTAAEGVPLTTKAFVAGPGPRGLHTQTMAQRMRTGRKKGSLLVKQVAQMVTLVQKHKVPLVAFGVVAKQIRVPKAATQKGVRERYTLSSAPAVAKLCVSLMNSKAIHLPMLVQKLLELELEPVAYELPVGGREAATALDLVCIHTPTGKYVPLELKTGTAEPFLNSRGMLRFPFQAFSNCVVNRYYLQTWLGAQFFRHTYPSLAHKTTNGLLVRVSRFGAWHSTLPKSFLAAAKSAVV
jgi:hypothetical protein